jgi:hypothetical protein
MKGARDAHGFTQYITYFITSYNIYIDIFILAVLWPVKTESILLRTSAVFLYNSKFNSLNVGYIAR